MPFLRFPTKIIANKEKSTNDWKLNRTSRANNASHPQEDKMLAKVIKCLTEMGCNSYAVLFCQCLSAEVDYSTAFKCLEERSTGRSIFAF